MLMCGVCLRNIASRRRMQYVNLILFVGCAKGLRWLEPGGFFAALSCRHRYPAVKVFLTPEDGIPGPELASAGLGSRAQWRLMALDVCAHPSNVHAGCMQAIC